MWIKIHLLHTSHAAAKENTFFKTFSNVYIQNLEICDVVIY